MLEEGPMSTSSNRVWVSFGWGLGTPVTRPRGKSPRGLWTALGFLKENSDWNGECWKEKFGGYHSSSGITLVAALSV